MTKMGNIMFTGNIRTTLAANSNGNKFLPLRNRKKSVSKITMRLIKETFFVAYVGTSYRKSRSRFESIYYSIDNFVSYVRNVEAKFPQNLSIVPFSSVIPSKKKFVKIRSQLSDTQTS